MSLVHINEICSEQSIKSFRYFFQILKCLLLFLLYILIVYRKEMLISAIFLSNIVSCYVYLSKIYH